MSNSSDHDLDDGRRALTPSNHANELYNSLENYSRNHKRVDVLSQYRKFARWHVRSTDMFVDFHDVLTAGTQWEIQEYGNLTREQFERKHQKDLATYKQMRVAIPQFREDMYRMQEGSKYFDSMVSMLNQAATRARGEDIASLTKRVIEYVRLEQPNKTLVPDLSPLASKKQRGHNHPVLSRLLCPAKYLVDFDSDPEGFRKKLLNGTVKVFAEDLPALVYHSAGYDKDDVHDGLFRNPILVRVNLQAHLHGAVVSSEQRERPVGKTKAPQAKLNGMKRVTVGAVLYAAVMFRHTISSVKDWRFRDKLFVQEHFFNEMALFFKEMDDEWVKDTLDWWNRNIFEESDIDQESLSDTECLRHGNPSTIDLARAQRRARTTHHGPPQPTTPAVASSRRSSRASLPPAPEPYLSRNPATWQPPSQDWSSQSQPYTTQSMSQDYRGRMESSPRRRSASPRGHRDPVNRPFAPRRRSRSLENQVAGPSRGDPYYGREYYGAHGERGSYSQRDLRGEPVEQSFVDHH